MTNSKIDLQKASKDAIFAMVLFLTTLAAPASASQCLDLFSKDTATNMTVSSWTPAFNVESPLFPYLTDGNAGKLFTHNYETRDRGQFGCKAIAVMVPGQKPQVYFFATGVLTQNFDIHHMEALKKVLTAEQQNNIESLYPFMQGYELTARRMRGQWLITAFATRSQLASMYHSIPEYKPSVEAEAALLDAVMSRIDASLIGF